MALAEPSRAACQAPIGQSIITTLFVACSISAPASTGRMRDARECIQVGVGVNSIKNEPWSRLFRMAEISESFVYSWLAAYQPPVGSIGEHGRIVVFRSQANPFVKVVQRFVHPSGPFPRPGDQAQCSAPVVFRSSRVVQNCLEVFDRVLPAHSGWFRHGIDLTADPVRADSLFLFLFIRKHPLASLGPAVPISAPARLSCAKPAKPDEAEIGTGFRNARSHLCPCHWRRHRSHRARESPSRPEVRLPRKRPRHR